MSDFVDVLHIIWANPPWLVASVITLAGVLIVSAHAYQYMRRGDKAMAVGLALAALALVGIALSHFARIKELG